MPSDRRLSRTVSYRRSMLGSDVAFMLGGALHLGLGVKASYLPRPQRYLVQGETVLSLWPIAAELGVKFGIDLL